MQFVFERHQAQSLSRIPFDRSKVSRTNVIIIHPVSFAILMILPPRQLSFLSQCFPNLLHALAFPSLITHNTKWINNRMMCSLNEVICLRSWHASGNIQILTNLMAEVIQWQIIDINTERVLDFRRYERNV